jgi:preprotein translocase subunit SecA
VLLRTIDSLWVEHLTEVDDMRRGIGLRGYAQQDPLNEFRREAYRLYEELSGLIRHQVASSIFRVTVTRQPPEPAPMTFDASALPGAGSATRAAATASGSGGGAAGTATSGSGVATAGQRPGGTIAAAGGGLASDPMARAMRESTNGSPSSPSGVKPGFTPSGARIGRNDPCYCGSGLKYKKCHGR